MKISIITPSYNSGMYLERAIQSVLMQGRVDYEHIIVDGGSTDNTLEILRKYPHLTWISERDFGQSDAMNKGFDMSKGEIIGYLNADDYYHPNIFDHVTHTLISSQEDMLVGDVIIEKSDRCEKRSPSIHYQEVIDYTRDLFPANPVSYFYKRQVQLKYGKFPVDNHQTMDLDFIFFVYRYFKVRYSPIVLGTFYLGGSNKTSLMNVRAEQRKVLFNFLQKHDKATYLQKRFDEFIFSLKKYLKKHLPVLN